MFLFFFHLSSSFMILRFASFADVSCVVDCPYEGFIAPKAVPMVRLNIIQRHLAIIILFNKQLDTLFFGLSTDDILATAVYILTCQHLIRVTKLLIPIYTPGWRKALWVWEVSRTPPLHPSLSIPPPTKKKIKGLFEATTILHDEINASV